jgi:tRNA threonylcarbamoyladenosine dehydratase
MPGPFSASPDGVAPAGASPEGVAPAGASPEGASLFCRTIDLLGQEGFERLQRAHVVVVGLGGVGGHAATALVRSGVGRLRIVDFDQVSWSSLNRSAYATAGDVGRPKGAVLAAHLEAICPGARVESVAAFFHTESAAEILAGSPDFVIDAIDSFTPKVALLRTCVERGLRVLSCMGASTRTDPTLLRVGDISETRVCPLARAVRRRLRHLGVRQGVATIYSIEPPIAPLPPDPAEETLRRGRVRNRQPSLGIMPGIFGYAAAGFVIRELTRGAGADLPGAGG